MPNRTVKLALSLANAGEISKDHYNERINIIKHVSLFRRFSTSKDVCESSIVRLTTDCNTAYLLTYLLKVVVLVYYIYYIISVVIYVDTRCIKHTLMKSIIKKINV